VVVAAYPAVAASKLAWVYAAIGIAAIAVLTVGLVFRRGVLLLWALVGLGASYAVWLGVGTHALDQRMPIVGAGLLLTAELAFDSLEPEVGRPEANVVLARATALVLLVLVSVAAGAVVLLMASIPLSGGVVVTALGAVAAVLALALITRLTAERR
jgi:hypothetical protein